MLERFPEDLYPMGRKFIEEATKGYELLKDLNIGLYGLARNCERQMFYNMKRVDKLYDLCNYLTGYVVTNGNSDNTKNLIRRPLTPIEVEDAPYHGSVISTDRYKDMARYRNIGLVNATSLNLWPGEFTAVLDFDTHGFSYDGFANSIYHMVNNPEIDFIGSNGLIYQDDVRLTYDALAFRRIGATGPHDITEINLTRYDRNDPLVHVQSCFGGLGIYRTSSLEGLEYKDDDCDHVTINRHLNCYLNPGMIVLYSKNPYEVY
jgi:hypothetical protein